MAETGYGIAGHKNNYSNTVRCGNWVEDSIGYELGRTRPDQSMDLRTTNRVAFQHPQKQEKPYVPDNVKLESNLEIRQKNHFGLPYDTLFTHAPNEDPSNLQKERYLSLAGNSFVTPDPSTLPTSPIRTRLNGTRILDSKATGPPQDARSNSLAVSKFSSTGNRHPLTLGMSAERPLTRQLEAKNARDRRMVNSFKTEHHHFTAHAPRIDYQVRAPPPGTVDMPSFDRTTEFSGSYVHKYG